MLDAVARLPGAEGDALLAELARLHTDIARDYEWMKAILSRESAAAVLLYVDLFAEGRFGDNPRGADAWHAGRELGPQIEKFPQVKVELRKRYEASTGAYRVLLEHIFEECGDEDDLIAMAKKYAATGRHYDGRIDAVVRAITLRQESRIGWLRRVLYPPGISRPHTKNSVRLAGRHPAGSGTCQKLPHGDRHAAG